MKGSLYLKKAAYCLLLSLSATWLPAQPDSHLLALEDLALIDADHSKPLLHQTLLIDSGRIRALFTTGSRPLPDSTERISCTGKFGVPGLIDTHVHMATDPSGTDNRDTTLRVLHDMLLSGVTSVRDMAGDARTLASLSRDAALDEIISPDIYYSALMAGPDFFQDPRTISSARGGKAGNMPYMMAVTDTTDLRLAVAEAKGTGATGIKLYADLSGSLAARIIAEARRQHILVWGHAWLSPAKPSELIRAGIHSLSHAPLLMYENLKETPKAWRSPHDSAYWNAIPLPDSLFVLMHTSDVLLDPTLITYQQLAAADSTRGYGYALGVRLVRAAKKAGVLISTGTDDDQTEFVQGEMYLLVQDAGFTPFEALVAATLNGAKTLGIENRVGTIAPGKQADLLLLNENPLQDIRNIRSVYAVVKKGKIWRKDLAQGNK